MTDPSGIKFKPLERYDQLDGGITMKQDEVDKIFEREKAKKAKRIMTIEERLIIIENNLNALQLCMKDIKDQITLLRTEKPKKEQFFI